MPTVASPDVDKDPALARRPSTASDASVDVADRPNVSMTDEERVQYMRAKSTFAKRDLFAKKPGSPASSSSAATTSPADALPKGITSQRAQDLFNEHEAQRQKWRADNLTAFDPASMGNGMLDQVASTLAHDPHDDTNEIGLRTGTSGAGPAAAAADLGLTLSHTTPISPLGAFQAGKGLVRDAADMYRERDGGAHIESVAKAQHEVRGEVSAARQQYAAAEEFRQQHASGPRTEENADMHDLAGKLRGRANIAKLRVGVLGGMKVDKAKLDQGMNSSPVREMTPEQHQIYEEMDADPSKREKGLADAVGTSAQGLRAGSEALEIASLAQIPLAGNTQKYVKSGQRGAAMLSHASDAVSSTVGAAGPQATIAKVGAGAGGVLLANAGQALAKGAAESQDNRDMAREKLDTRDQGTGLEQIAERGFRPKHVEAEHPVLRTFEDPDKRGYLERMQDSASSMWNSFKSGASKAWDGAKDLAGKAWEGTKDLAGKAWEGTKSAASYVGGALASGARAVGRGASAVGRSIASGAEEAGSAIASGARSLGGYVTQGMKSLGRGLRRPGRRPGRGIGRR